MRKTYMKKENPAQEGCQRLEIDEDNHQGRCDEVGQQNASTTAISSWTAYNQQPKEIA